MVQAPSARFRFDFDDLRPEPSDLRVIGGHPALPADVVDVAPAVRRPRWLPRLLPVFRSGQPLHVEVVGTGTFPGLLIESLTAVLATAGAEARIRVALVEGGFVAGCPDLGGLPAGPPITLVPADLTVASVAAAAAVAGSRPRSLLVLNGSLPRLDRHLRIPPQQALCRLPLIGRRELEAVRSGVAPGLHLRGFGTGCLGLAQRVVNLYSAGLE